MTEQDDEATQRINQWMASTEPNDAELNAWLNTPGATVAGYLKMQAEQARRDRTPEQVAFDEAFDDFLLDAAHWDALPAIGPQDAAMLLCQHNPNETFFDNRERQPNPKETPFDIAARCTNDETGPRELIQLKQRFEALETMEPAKRSLRDWLAYARSQSVKYHSWIDRYVEARPAPAQPHSDPAPEVADQTEAVVAGGDVPAPMKRNRKPSWSVEAMPYMRQLYKAGKYKSATVFYKALMNRADTPDSPFTKHKGELYCEASGTTVAEGTVGTKWAEIRSS